MSPNYARYIGVGVTFFLIIVGLATGGYLLDNWIGTLPLFLLFGVVAGFAAALGYVYLQLKNLGGG